MKKLSKEKRETFERLYGYWIQILKNEINSVWSIMIFYVGKKGAGKSYSAIKDGLELDPKLTIDQILFKKEEVDQFIDKEMIQKLQIIRETDLTFLVVLPHLIFGDSSVDALANFCAEVHKPNHREDPYRIAKALEMEGLYSKRKRMEFRPIWYKGQIFHIPYLNPKKNNKTLFKEYHKKKTAYVIWRTQQNKEKEEDRGLTGKQLNYLRLFIKEYSITEVANELGVTEQAVKEMKRKLRRKGALN